tara:strand:- start:1149 stop:1577 length:429 start_codon:yes stop_codon:yes gene_type:complete
VINDGHITLDRDYTKGSVIAVRKVSSGGAAYAKNIQSLNENHEHIINWFYLFDSKDNPEEPMTHAWFRKADFQRWWFEYPSTRDLMNSGPFSARFSELIKFGIFLQTEQVKESYLKTKRGPFYKMNWNRIKEIQKNGGLIWD